MRHSLRCRVAALAALALVVACGNDGMSMGDMAPERLVIDGNYSDERFIDMMAAHHQAEEIGQLGEYRKSWYGTQP
ncbi:hypothetical protein [Archangium sp.]|uniref:hypothetical protein n=1 Tax=Archangium sp. TaxID=1872627 RepID=UPI00286B9181|nr:hypothetical protein [Archangium sp.]